jgi:hypothetical protein
MSNNILKSLIGELVESYLEESYEDDLVESIFEEVSEETWEAIEEAILNELSPKTLASYVNKAKADEKRLDKKAEYHDGISSKYHSSAMRKHIDSKGHKKDYDTYKRHQDSATKTLAKSRKRGQGIARALDRGAKDK